MFVFVVSWHFESPPNRCVLVFVVGLFLVVVGCGSRSRSKVVVFHVVLLVKPLLVGWARIYCNGW